jgi:uncharacterized protein YegL
MTLFFLVDSSGSMDGSKIGTLNSTMEEVIPMLRELSEENADAQIKIAALEFSDGVRWLTPSGPVEPANFRWNPIYANGLTDFGAACRELNAKLSAKAFMSEATGSYAPAIFLLSDGVPTDEWESQLNALKQNNWFRAGVKAAVAIGGDETDYDNLAEFTGSHEAVLTVHSAAALKKAIKFVSVRASQVASRSAAAGAFTDAQKQDELNEALGEFKVEVAQDGGDEW